MFHQTITFCVEWVAPVMMAGFFVSLPHFLDRVPPGKH